MKRRIKSKIKKRDLVLAELRAIKKIITLIYNQQIGITSP